jgi:iron complex outermembrane receptor protein
MGYASYSVGYRSGGFNGRPTTAASASQPYNPEKVQSFEVGAKTEWLENRLVINGDVFLTKYKDKQEQVVESSTIAPYDETVVANAASATIKGVELEFKALPSKGLILHGSLGLLDAAYDHFYALTCTTPDPANTAPATPDNPQPKCPLVQADLKSLTMKETPHTSFSLGFDYSMPSPLGLWTLSSNYSYISSYQTTIVAAVGNPFDNDPRALRQPEKTLNSALRWSHEYGQSEAQISVWGRNLLNDRGLGDGVLPVGGGGYSAAGLPAVDLWTFGYARSPRMFGVNVGYKYR